MVMNAPSSLLCCLFLSIALMHRNTRFPSRWLDVAEDIELEEPLKAPRLRVPPVRKRLLDELRSRPKTRWAKFVAWSKEYLCCCLVGCCRRNVEEKKGFEAEKLVEVVVSAFP